MKVLQINTVYKRGSTGRIVEQIQQMCIDSGIENIVAYRYSEDDSYPNIYCISSWLDCHVHNRIARYTHRSGFYSRFKTKKFIQYIDNLKPDIIHIHNLHGSYVNIELLFEYIKKNHIKTIWTFHDCWPFTGYCPYFNIYECEEWNNGCDECCCETNLLNKHNARKNLNLKKNLVDGLELTIITPSNWLAELVKQSFYSRFEIKTIYNGIDLQVFKPTKSVFRNRYNIPNSKFILLGVASIWEKRKGLDDFIELSKRMDREKFQIVLVGTNDSIDQMLPKNIISINRTENQTELAEIYTASDLFVNPTRDEVLGLVNIEANACGTPVITYKSGGSPECITEKTGSVVECGNIDAMEKEIIRICETRPYSSEACIEQAKKFDMNEKYKEYVELYKEISNL